jgi:hypothetical protein
MAFSFTTVFMAPSTPTKSAATRPGPLRSTKSLPRNETPDPSGPQTRPQRASTIQNGTAPEINVVPGTPQRQQHGNSDAKSDAFGSSEGAEEEERPRASVDLDDLPIELVSMTDK